LNPNQFKQKKKRRVDPDRPRPNLFSHEKKLKENQETVEGLMAIIDDQRRQLDRLQNKLNTLESTVNIIAYNVRKR
jgi:predicted RNase H-like nuclease (RuvC/YqgF family)